MSELGKEISNIKDFWDDQADRYSADLKATTPDLLLKQIELEALRRALDPAADVLEAGCGNGFNLASLANTLNGRLVGFDYSSKMISAAQISRKESPFCDRLHFEEADILGDLSSLGTFPQVFTDRCLINLPSLDLQIEAVKNLSSTINVGGTIILLECSKNSLLRLNEMRECVDLQPINEHWHNNYIDEEPFLFAVSKFIELVDIDYFSSTYYLASRIFNAKLTPPGLEPDYLSEINQIAASLPSLGDIGPHKLFKFRRLA